MAGAIVLAAEAAIRSGVGLVHTHVHADSVLTLQISVPQAITHVWEEAATTIQAMAIGPGFGRTIESMRVMESQLRELPDIPLVLDADVLTIIGSDVKRLKKLCSRHQVVCTPHEGEFARLLGAGAARSLDGRVQQAMELANATGATVLLKGTPNVVVSPDSAQVIIVPRGTPVLATGGSGDMLTGVIGALLAQGAAPAHAATVGAWVHGRAAEIATELAGTVRGVTLHDVLRAMPAAWREVVTPNAADVDAAGYSVLASLPRVPSEHVW
jgi:NAD(P)H-hydrate epimerase